MAIIGPGMTDDDYASGKVTPLDIFEGRVKAWTLAFARKLAKQEDSGTATLLLTASVLEPMGGTLLGGGTSERKFCAGFLRVFPDVPGGNAEGIAPIVCDLLRDGLFHEGFFKAGLILEYGRTPIEQRGTAIVVDPRRFLHAVDSGFGKLCDEIRAADGESALRKSFDAYWTKKLGDQGNYAKARFDPNIGNVATSTSTAAVMPPEMWFTKL
jgi:hypothetical protein